MRAARGRVIVRPVETEQTLGGGRIILPESVREGMSQYQCEVVSVGKPDICEDKKCERPHWIEGTAHSEGIDEERQHVIPVELCVGSWCLVRPRSFLDAGDPSGKLYIVHLNDIEAVFEVKE